MVEFTLNVGESLKIGKEIAVKVVGRSGQRAVLTIEAPRSLKIWRTNNKHDKAAPSGGRNRDPETTDT